METQDIRLMLVDDHTMVRKGMKVVLDEYEGICVVGEAANGLNAIQLVEQLNPDVVLIDLMMPGMDGIETIRRIIAIRPDQGIIVLTAYEKEDMIFQAVQAGAMGFLVKSARPDELVEAIRNVHAGMPALDEVVLWRLVRGKTAAEPDKKISHLSEREMEVFQLLAKGYTDQEIAEKFCLTDVTVRTHISRILSKLGVTNRVQAALFGLRSGIVSLETARYIDV